MGFYNNLCPGCMNEVGEAENCPYCGFDLKSEQSAPFLAYGTVLAGKYVVGEILEQNSEGTTYLGLDTITNNCVRIREFFPFCFADREKDSAKITVNDENSQNFRKLLTDFLDMWHRIMKLRSLDSLITVLDVFEANDTAYAIAEADGSQTLTDYITKNGGNLKWDDICKKILPVMDTIEALNNAGIVHGAISPDTLFLCSNGQFKPWGFGIEEIRKTEGLLETDIRPGFAAIEQYGKDAELSAATDVYGFISVLYKCVTGNTPIDAEIRSHEDTLSIPAVFARELPDYVLAAFIGALQVKPADRTQNFSRLKGSFTKEAFERQKQQAAALTGTSLIDPISDLEPTDIAPEKTSDPVIVNSTGEIPVLKKDTTPEKTTSVASTIVLSLSIVFVMLIFFVCLALTGIVSFNIGGVGSTAKVVEIPDFTNYNKTDAYITEVAQEYGLHIKLQATSSSTYAEGVIFDQDIAAGTKVEKGSTINLYYSKGASTVTLPNFTGMTFTETVYYLGKLNLSYNIVEKANPGNQPAGTVVSMTPAANSVVYEGTEITIEIWGESGNGDVTGSETGSQITSSSSILDSIFGRLSDSVSGLGDTIQNFIG